MPFRHKAAVAHPWRATHLRLAAWLRRCWPLVVYAWLVAPAVVLRLGGLTQLPHTLWVDKA